MRTPRLFPAEVSIPEEIRPAVEAWLAYKREQFRFTYKPLALGVLVRKLTEMGPERAMAAVEWSMQSGYKGVFECLSRGEREAPGKPIAESFCTPEQLAHVKRMVELQRPEGAESIRSLAYYRKVFEGLGPEAFEPGYIAYVEDAYNRRKS